MSLSHFIARRIHFQPSEKNRKSVSKPAVRIATIGIALGMAVMLVALAVVTGFQNEVSQKVFGFGSHIQISALTNNQTYEMPPITVNDTIVQQIKNLSNVKQVEPFAVKPTILKTSQDFEGIVLKGVNSQYNWQFISDNLTAGALPNLIDSVASNEVLLSEETAKQLQLNIGDGVLAYFIQDNIRVRKFTICGIYNTGLVEFDKMFMWGDMRHIQQLNNWKENQVSGIEIGLYDWNKMSESAYDIFQLTARTYGSGYENPYYTRTMQELQPQIFNWLGLLDMNMIVILILMISVAGFTMISGILILILDKTNLIGTLKALGANNWTIQKIFLYQASYLIGKGMIWGNAIGLFLCWAQYHFGIIQLDPAIYFVNTVPIELNLLPWILLNVGVAVITLSMMLLPSLVIAKISPAKAIKFD